MWVEGNQIVWGNILIIVEKDTIVKEYKGREKLRKTKQEVE